MIELMIVVAIIGVLASLAIPQYQTYAKRSKFTEVVMQASKLKNAIEVCFNTRGSGQFVNCDSEVELGISLSDVTANPKVSSASIGANTAIITLTSIVELDSATYVLTPVLNSGSIVWQQSGTCVAAGFC